MSEETTAKKCKRCGTVRDPNRPYCVPCHAARCATWHEARRKEREAAQKKRQAKNQAERSRRAAKKQQPKAA